MWHSGTVNNFTPAGRKTNYVKNKADLLTQDVTQSVEKVEPLKNNDVPLNSLRK